MTKEEVLKLARQADNINCDCCLPDPGEEFMEDFLVAFAALVRADERDRAMRENAYVAAEREACAKVCEETDAQDWMDCAAAIRARGQA